MGVNKNVVCAADIPPLEDMSQELEKVQALRSSHKRIHESSPSQWSSLKQPTSSVNSTDSKQPSCKDEVNKKLKDHGDSKSSFGGFKKGFLVSSSGSKSCANRPPAPPTSSRAATKASSKDSNIPLIKPKHKEKSSLEFPEVQQAMKESFPLLQSQGTVGYYTHVY